MHNFFLHKNILIFRRFFNSANRLKKINLPCKTTWEIYFVLFYLFRNRLSKNLIKNSIIILFYRKFELFLQRK